MTQLGLGRVSLRQTPWLQNWPAAQSASCVQEATHWRSTQLGAMEGHGSSAGQVATGTVVQTPSTQENPEGHALLQLTTHWPSAQVEPAAHSLAYLQASRELVHNPAAHTVSALQSAPVSQGHGPLVPPHGTQVSARHVVSLEQSRKLEQSLATGIGALGATHRSALHTVP